MITICAKIFKINSDDIKHNYNRHQQRVQSSEQRGHFGSTEFDCGQNVRTDTERLYEVSS